MWTVMSLDQRLLSQADRSTDLCVVQERSWNPLVRASVALLLSFVMAVLVPARLAFGQSAPDGEPRRISTSPVAASESVESRAASSAKAPGSGSATRTLLLTTGGVVTGRIKEIATGYVVSSAHGSVVVPHEHVVFEASDLREIYELLKSRDKEPTVASCLKRADWCLSHKLPQEAAEELRDALHLDPANETVRLMLNRVDQELRQQARAAGPQSGTTVSRDGSLTIRTERPDWAAAMNAPAAKSLAGLDPETARRFVSVVQPILQSRCGNARCHGPAAENEFKLQHTRSSGGNPRLTIEKNLGLVLKYVDLQQPARSRLLTVGDGAHAGQTIFNGRAGAIQQESLRQWVLEVARQSGTGSTPAAPVPLVNAASPAASGNAVPSSLPEAPADSGQPLAAATDAAGNPAQVTIEQPMNEEPRPLTSFQKLLHEVGSADKRRDAFDPEEFNRRFGTSGDPAR